MSNLEQEILKLQKQYDVEKVQDEITDLEKRLALLRKNAEHLFMVKARKLGRALAATGVEGYVRLHGEIMDLCYYFSKDDHESWMVNVLTHQQPSSEAVLRYNYHENNKDEPFYLCMSREACSEQYTTLCEKFFAQDMIECFQIYEDEAVIELRDMLATKYNALIQKRDNCLERLSVSAANATNAEKTEYDVFLIPAKYAEKAKNFFAENNIAYERKVSENE